MEKTGKNASCPCGSGLKYMDCCMDSILSFDGVARMLEHWYGDDVDALSTEVIFDTLRGYGIDTDAEEFRELAEQVYSADELAKHWKDTFTITARGLDEDFIWLASCVLWDRLASDVISSEYLNELMQSGYGLVEQGGEELVEGCGLWFQVWEYLKPRFTADMKSVEVAETVFSGMQSLFNWVQDFETELGNASHYDSSFYQKTIDFCSEFCALFPESEELLMVNMKRAAAASYFHLGQIEKGDQAFEALIQEHPDNVWSYIGWGDMYCSFRQTGIEEDLPRARRIYEMALHIKSMDSYVVIERITSLDDEKSY